MARSNQPPKPECCRAEGQVQVPEQGAEDQTTARKRTQGDSQAASESRTSLKQFSPETILQRAGGDAVASAEPNTDTQEAEVLSRHMGAHGIRRPSSSWCE